MGRVGRTASILAIAAMGTWVVTAQIAEASTSSYPPIVRTVPSVPSACTSANSIPPVPADQVQSMERTVTTFVGDHLVGLGQCGHGLLVVTLTPGSEPLAQRVRAKFGSSVQIMVGYTVWNGHPGRSPTCGTLAEPTSTPAGYTMNLDLGSRRVEVGGNLTGHVALHDTSTQSVEVLTGSPIEVVITKPGTRRVVGVDSRPIAGTAYVPLLGPDQSKNVAIVGGTARCDGGIGSALPPGPYDAVAEVSGVGIDGPGEPGGMPPTYFTPIVPIQIVR